MTKNKTTRKLALMPTKRTKSFNIKDSVGLQLSNILKLKRRFIDFEMKKLGLSRSQWQVLLWMKILGPCSQKELLKNLDIDAAHLVRILEEFEKNNYIFRTSVKGDRRALFIQMTDYGQQYLMPHMDIALMTENAALLQGLSVADKKYLHKILQTLTANMKLLLNTQTILKAFHS